jgi:CP family cyanate transporter-like MFS transporter
MLKNKNNLFLIIGIVFIAFVLRAPIIAIGSLVKLIRIDLGITNGTAGFITTIPLFTFAVVSPFVSKISSRFGIRKTMLDGLIVLLCGILIRSYTGTPGVFIGTAVIGIGIAFGNVLIPAIIKSDFPLKVGLLTSIYTTAMAALGGVCAGISLPLANAANWGWRNSLGVWSILCIAAMTIWMPQVLNKGPKTAAPQKIRDTIKEKSVYLSGLAWQVTIYMGLQSLLYYSFIAWLPTIVQCKGNDAGTAGYLALMFQLVTIPPSLIVPLLADHMKNQKLLVTLSCIVYIIGMTGFLFSTSGIWLIISIALCGIGQAASFSLSICLIGLRSSNAKQASELSGMSQSVGYILAAIGPTLIGALYDFTSSWTIQIILFVAVIIILFLSGLYAGADKHLFKSTNEKQTSTT